MRDRTFRLRAVAIVLTAVALSIASGAFERAAAGQAQGAAAAQAPAGAQGRGRGQAPPTAQAQAPIDLTGWWVSIVTEDWRWRMVTPPKGDYSSIPISPEGRRIGDSWDPAKDEREGNACRSYGAAAIMRVPGRVHITWQDESTLKIDTDAGTQTRLLHFNDAQPPAGEQGWQGYSAATWEIAGAAVRGGGGAGGGGAAAGTAARGAAPAAPRYGSLKVVTTHMKAGYLRKNGVPYSENAVVTEYFDRHNESNGDQWFTVTTTVDDSKYLQQPFITSTGFKKEADGAKWRPTPCAAQ
jgi:hypothetical protein